MVRLANRIHFSASVRITVANCCRSLPKISKLKSVSVWRTSGDCSVNATLACSLSRIARGNFAGAIRPYQTDTSKPGTPDSARSARSAATTSGSQRIWPARASARFSQAEIALDVVRQVGCGARLHRKTRRHKNSVCPSGAARGHFRGDHARRARAVIHHELLAPGFGEFFY